MNKGIRAYVAEFLGTFIFFFAGTSAVLGSKLLNFGDSAGIIVPMAFGVGLVIAVFAVGHISGAHLNPAVSIAFAVKGKFPWSSVPGYVVAQLLAGVVVAAIQAYCFAKSPGYGAAVTLPGAVAGTAIPVSAVALFEFLATFALMFVITSVATDARAKGVPAGLAIGFTVLAMALGVGWVSGGSFNPARSFGPALIGGDFAYQWVYWVFPILGAIAGVFTYDYIRGNDQPNPDPLMRDPTAG